MNKEYRKIEDLQAYVCGKINDGAEIVKAEKFSGIAARQGIPGEEIISWSVDASGIPIKEKTAVVSVDEVTGKPDWVVTKVEENGKEIIDANGNLNQWIISHRVFEQRYEKDEKQEGLFKSNAGVQRFLCLDEAIHIMQWGEVWNVDAGGYINITKEGDYYVISKRDFEDTYKILTYIGGD